MSKEREALKLALEALELEDMACRYEKDPTPEHIAKAITAIREALAEQPARHDLKPKFVRNVDGVPCITLVEHEHLMLSRSKPAQQQEPVAWLTPRTFDGYMRPDLGYETCSKTDYAAFPVYASPGAQGATHDR